MPKGVPLAPEALSQTRHAVFAAALPLFGQKGFIETSMREVAAAAGMSKSSLYDYFPTKDDILLWYVEDEIADATALAREIAAKPLSATEKLHQILRMQFERVVASRELHLRLQAEVQRLSADSRNRIRAKRHAYQDLLSRVIEQGIANGSFRPVDPLLATHVFLMVLVPVIFTSRPTGTPDQMVDEAFGLFLRGVQA